MKQPAKGRVEFVSEPIDPDAGTFDTAAMGRGLIGLPTGFTWRDQHYAIAEVLEQWKLSEAEDHRHGELYFRKQFWRVRVDRGEIMVIYAVRHTKQGESPKKRWWLYTIETAGP